jgi:hypothetical protein
VGALHNPDNPAVDAGPNEAATLHSTLKTPTEALGWVGPGRPDWTRSFDGVCNVQKRVNSDNAHRQPCGIVLVVQSIELRSITDAAWKGQYVLLVALNPRSKAFAKDRDLQLVYIPFKTNVE